MMPLADAARLSVASYAQYEADPNNLAPALMPGVADMYDLVAHVTGADALLGAQKIGLGERKWYGMVLHSKADFTQYVYVIRGTQDVVEWIEDCEFQMIDGVELGFYSIYASMSKLPVIPEGCTLTVIGHSLGSALATYVTLGLAAVGVKVNGIFLASPKPGNAAFAARFDDVVKRENYIVVNYLRDVVPRLPIPIPFVADYRALPNVLTLRPSESTAIVPDNVKSNHQATSYLALLSTRSTP